MTNILHIGYKHEKEKSDKTLKFVLLKVLESVICQTYFYTH